MCWKSVQSGCEEKMQLIMKVKMSGLLLECRRFSGEKGECHEDI